MKSVSFVEFGKLNWIWSRHAGTTRERVLDDEGARTVFRTAAVDGNGIGPSGHMVLAHAPTTEPT